LLNDITIIRVTFTYW